MPTTFDLFYLGTGPEIDTIEGNNTSENHNALNGLSYGGESDPLALNVQTLSPASFQGPGADGDWGSYNANNYQANERFQIDGGAERTFDALMIYANTVVTYTDGTTATVEAIVMQDTGGRLYLVPSATGPTPYTDALEAKPIESVTLGTAQPANGNEVYHMYADRFQMTFKDGVIEGTGGDDFIDANYIGDPEGDRVDNTDNLAGTNDDVIDAGAGNDTIYFGAGDNTVHGGDGNDLIDDVSGAQLAGDDYLDGGAGEDTIYGGGGADTVLGGDGHDLLLGEDGDDVIYGGEGDDTISGGDGNDVIYGDGSSEPGLWSYEVWNYDFSSANGQAFDAENGTLAGSGTTQDFDSASLVHDERGTSGDPEDFGVIYRSTLQPSESGVFTFSTTSDDGSTIRIYDADGNLLTWTNQDGSTATFMDNDYHQGATTRTGQVTLEEGAHYTIEVRHWENQGAEVISGTVTSPSGTTEDLADSSMILGPDVGSGNDVIEGGAGADTIHGGEGDDTLTGGDGDDVLSGGAGDDLFAFADGHGSNIVTDFDMGDADSDGFTNDQLDVSELTDADGNPIRTHDVAVSDDGSGNAILTFPDNTTVTLHGVDPNTLDAGTLYSMGVPCFVTGTRIATPGGPRAVESLKPGDLVSTFDGGALPVVWAARSDLDAETLAQQPGLRPVRIRAGALGNARDILLSPQHRVALGASQRPEGFVPARWLAEDGDGRFRVAKGKRAVSYVHLMLARHAVVLAEGAPVESFYPGPQALAALDVFARAGLFLRFPALSTIRSRADACARYGPLALPELDRREIQPHISPPVAAPTRTAASGHPARSATGA
jgi:Ca2+-binding RTX toxin-like protein